MGDGEGSALRSWSSESQSFQPGNWCQKVCRFETMAPVLGYEGKDGDQKPKCQLRGCSSERSQAQIDPEASANGNYQGRQNPATGWVWWARQEQRVSSRLLQSQLQGQWCYH